MTFYRITRRLGAILTALTLGACAAPAPAPLEIRSGVIEQINPTQIASNQHQGVGAVIGGLTGVGIGSLIGGGPGPSLPPRPRVRHPRRPLRPRRGRPPPPHAPLLRRPRPGPHRSR